MGADNWAYCPRCKKKHDIELEKLRDKTAKAYGKVSSEKYLEMLEQSQKPETLAPSLREDYEIGIDEFGLFEVIYSGSCSQCNFHFNFKIEKDVPLTEKSDKEKFKIDLQNKIIDAAKPK